MDAPAQQMPQATEPDAAAAIDGPRSVPALASIARSRESEADEPARPKLANDPSHPDHATFARIHDWGRGTGQWDDGKSLNVAAALYREQAGDPLVRRVDQVVGGLGRDGAQNVFAVHSPFGDREQRFHVQVDGRIASLQPAQANLAQAETLTQQRAQEQVMQQEMSERQVRSGQALAR